MSRSKAKDADKTIPIAVRLPPKLVQRLDLHVERMNRTAPAGITYTRAEAFRNGLTIGLDDIEAAERASRD